MLYMLFLFSISQLLIPINDIGSDVVWNYKYYWAPTVAFMCFNQEFIIWLRAAYRKVFVL